MAASALDGLSPALAEAVRPHLDECVALLHDRPALLRRLQRCQGIGTLGERQAVANALARAKREGRITPSTPPPPLPTAAAVRASATSMLARARAQLQQQAGPSTADAAVLKTLGAAADEELLSALPIATVCRTCEALGMPPGHARLLREVVELGSPRVAFYTSQMSERGTEVSLYDYAHFGEEMLGITAFIVYDATSPHNVPGVIRKFEARFGARVIGIDHPIGLDLKLQGDGSVLRREAIDFLYVLKLGTRESPSVDGLSGGGVRTLVHAVFDGRHEHGDVYARISPCVPGRCAVVPHVVRPRAAEGADMRAQLGIPTHATVFGRFGGLHTFDIPFVREVIVEVATERPDVYFLLLNTEEGCEAEAGLPNVLHLPALIDDDAKCAFIRSCDAMLHARSRGETFGLAVAEFSAHNRPVLTSSAHHDGGLARYHLDVLAERGLFYRDRESLRALLLGFDREAAKARDWNAYRAFEPRAVMRTFRQTFLVPRAAPASAERSSD